MPHPNSRSYPTVPGRILGSLLDSLRAAAGIPGVLGARLSRVRWFRHRPLVCGPGVRGMGSDSRPLRRCGAGEGQGAVGKEWTTVKPDSEIKPIFDRVLRWIVILEFVCGPGSRSTNHDPRSTQMSKSTTQVNLNAV